MQLGRPQVTKYTEYTNRYNAVFFLPGYEVCAWSHLPPNIVDEIKLVLQDHHGKEVSIIDSLVTDNRLHDGQNYKVWYLTVDKVEDDAGNKVEAVASGPRPLREAEGKGLLEGGCC